MDRLHPMPLSAGPGREASMRGLPITVVNVVAPTLISSTMAPNDTVTPRHAEYTSRLPSLLSMSGRPSVPTAGSSAAMTT
jgi:hypothetical protein